MSAGAYISSTGAFDSGKEEVFQARPGRRTPELKLDMRATDLDTAVWLAELTS